MQAMESQFDVCTEDLFNQTIKLEEMEKKAGNAEGEVSSLRSRLILLQENNEKQEDRLCKATLELAGACKRADQAVRKRIELENGVSSNEESIDNLDKQLGDSNNGQATFLSHGLCGKVGVSTSSIPISTHGLRIHGGNNTKFFRHAVQQKSCEP